MEFGGEKKHMVDILFVLTLFFVFALSALTLVILGANIYKSTVNHMEESFTDRTSYAYVTQKLRQNDEAGALALGYLGDEEALIMTQEVNNTIYNTYVYSHDGYLCELLSRADMEMDPSAGTKIISIEDLSFDEAAPGLYSVEVTTEDGETIPLLLSSHTAPRGGDRLED